jgi:hypothetical protein
MKAVSTAKPRKASSLKHKPRVRAKKKFDLSWLLDRPLPPANELPENPVIFLRNLS